jgi:hypothetical protein
MTIARIVLFLAIPFIVGCSSNNAGKIEGTHWTSQACTFKGKMVPAGFLKLSFYKDGSITYQAGNLTFNGKYTLGMGDSVTFELNRELAGRKTHNQKCVIVEDRLTVSDTDGTKMNFTKK